MRKVRLTTLFVYTSLVLCVICYMAATALLLWIEPLIVILPVGYITFVFLGVWIIETLSK